MVTAWTQQWSNHGIASTCYMASTVLAERIPIKVVPKSLKPYAATAIAEANATLLLALPPLL